MRTLTAALVATSLMASSAFAAPLPAGKPAGAKEAAILGPNAFIVFVGIAVVAGGLAATLSNNSNNGVQSSTTSSTGTSGLP